MGFLTLKKKTKECFLALDVGTEAVKAVVFRKEGQAYYVLGNSLKYFDELKPFNNNNVIFQAKEEAVEKSGVNPEYLLASLPPNLLRNKIDNIVVSRKNSKEIIGKKEEQNALGSALEESQKRILHSLQNIYFVNHDILEIKIDGYEVPGLAGYSGKNLEFKILASFLPKEQFDNFNKVFGALQLKSSRVVNPIKNIVSVFEINEGVFIDIGGTFTDFFIIKNGKIEITGGFEMGGREFSRVFSEKLGMLGSQARAFKENYSLGEATDKTISRIKEMLAPAIQEWQMKLDLKLKDLKASHPGNFFLFGGGSLLPGLGEGIMRAGKLKFIYPKDIGNIIDAGGAINTPQYINSILLAHG